MAKKQDNPKDRGGQEVGKPKQTTPTPAEINRRNAEYWNDKDKQWSAAIIAIEHARSRTARVGAEITNAPKAAARAKVRELWFELSERERAKRGIVSSFATKTAAKVKNSTVSGIQRWIGEFRKEPPKR